jgi:hypothetical protein
LDVDDFPFVVPGPFETVSRTLTHMENLATIEVAASRRIVLRNRAALTRLNA